MDNRTLYWRSLVRWKYEVLCMEYAYRREVKTSRGIRIFVSLVSSSAIAAWALWGAFPFVWGLVVVLANIAATVHELTPYSERIHDVAHAADELGSIYETAEATWYEIQSDKYSEEEVLKFRSRYADKIAETTRTMMKNDAFSISRKTADRLERETDSYFNYYYGEIDAKDSE